MSRKKNQGKRLTMKELIANEAPRIQDTLFNKARTASKLAKSLRGSRARVLYAQKARCLRQLISHGGDAVRIEGDLRLGLLSVSLDKRRRLHTHEAWLSQGSDWWRLSL